MSTPLLYVSLLGKAVVRLRKTVDRIQEVFVNYEYSFNL